MAIVTQFLVELVNRPGSLAETCSQLAAKAVNIQAISVPRAGDFSTVRLVVNQTAVARKVFDSMGIKYSEEDVLLVRVSDRPGSLGRVTRKLAENKINIEYVYGTIEKGASDALVVVSVSNLKKAAQLLK